MLKQFLKTAVILAVPAMIAASAHADETVTTPFGKTKLDALVQFWTVNDTTVPSVNTGNGTSGGAKLDMKLRRAEIGLTGNVTDTTRYGIMVDPARQTWGNGASALYAAGGNNVTAPYWETDTGILRDAWVSQEVFMPELELKVGQFKIPTTAEGLDANGELMFPERSMVARTFGDDYEPGIQLSYKQPMWKIAGMISDGRGPDQDAYPIADNVGNYQPTPNSKNLSFRADVKPMEMFSAGAFTTLTNFSYADRFAAGINARVMPIEDLVIRFEGVRGRQRVDAATGNWVTGATGSTTEIPMNGWTVDAGYQFGDFQPVLRYEVQQAEQTWMTGSGTPQAVTGRAITAGLNYYFAKNNYKLQLAYSNLSNVNGSAFGNSNADSATGMYYTEAGYGGSLFTLAFQAAL